MMNITVHDFGEWRDRARDLFGQGVAPVQVRWNEAAAQAGLFADSPATGPSGPPPSVSREFMALAFTLSCHRDPARWSLLYEALWRLASGEKHLLRLATDPLVHTLRRMEKQVRRDAHKAKAFVRFRRTVEDGLEHYIASHEPDHFILPIVGPFFQRRFAVQLWTILTPDASLHWNGHALAFGPGAHSSMAPEGDVLEDLWRSYYRATFNPARIKLGMMKSEMPVRYWRNLPETSILSEMLEEAPERVERMLAYQEGTTLSASQFLPASGDIAALEAASKSCEGCPLFGHATQTVFGVGPVDAPLMLVGEQPGDEEDRRGRPFVGPAGTLLDNILIQVGIDRARLYVTNAVKHFKFTRNGTRRIHASPARTDVVACQPWLLAEIRAVKPKVILALGATAGKSLKDAGFTLKHHRGMWWKHGESDVTATYHPSALLRAEGDMRRKYHDALIHDLHMAAKRAGL